MKEKIIFACEWDKNKETSWSGTHMSIRKRLDMNFDVIDFDYGIRKPYTFMSKVMNKAFHKKIKVSKHYTHSFKHKYKSNNLIFTFGVTPNVYDETNKHFVYQDMSWNNVKDLYYNDKDIFNVSAFQTTGENDINNFTDEQNEFYNHDNVYCLTMGQWLAKYLINEVHIPADRVCFVGGGDKYRYI